MKERKETRGKEGKELNGKQELPGYPGLELDNRDIKVISPFLLLYTGENCALRKLNAILTALLLSTSII